MHRDIVHINADAVCSQIVKNRFAVNSHFFKIDFDYIKVKCIENVFFND